MVCWNKRNVPPTFNVLFSDHFGVVLIMTLQIADFWNDFNWGDLRPFSLRPFSIVERVPHQNFGGVSRFFLLHRSLHAMSSSCSESKAVRISDSKAVRSGDVFPTFSRDMWRYVGITIVTIYQFPPVPRILSKNKCRIIGCEVGVRSLTLRSPRSPEVV